MPIQDKIIKYSVSINQNNNFNYFRIINLSLESGGKAYIGFPKDRPVDWLQFNGSTTILYMTQDEFAEVYHMLQSESPVFFTALDLFSFMIGSVHTELDLNSAETPGEEEQYPQNLEALIKAAKRLGMDRVPGNPVNRKK